MKDGKLSSADIASAVALWAKVNGYKVYSCSTKTQADGRVLVDADVDIIKPMPEDATRIDKRVIAAYLDACIINWRKKKEQAEGEEDALIAACYVDAFQIVRSSLLGKLLP